MTKVTYTTNNGKIVNTLAEAQANGGVAITHYTPIEEPIKLTAKQKERLIKC